ncbi:MAG: hypothetical protein ABFD86_03460 [Bryobacteraceae bacterium]
MAVFGSTRVPVRANVALGEKALREMPSWFEPNRGQMDPKVRFEARSQHGRLAIHSTGARLTYPEGSLELTLSGANAKASHTGEQLQAARTNYLLGNRADRWKMDVPHYARVRWSRPYPGIDVAYYLNDSRFEYDMVVAPGADPGRIRLRFGGARAMRLDADGSLRFDLGGAEVRQLQPVAYQQIGANRVSVEARYRTAPSGEVTIALGSYDKARTLVIDPIIYAGYTKGQSNQVVRDVKLDKDGNIWITGSAFGEIDVTNLPTPYKNYSSAYRDAFVAKFSINENGQLTLLYWSYFGGSDYEVGTALGINSDGWVYVAGETSSSDFPTAGTKLQDAAGGETDAFLLVINPALSGTDSLIYSRYWGGDKDETVRGMALDRDGHAIVIGTTGSATLTAVEYGVQGANRGGWDIYLLKVDPKPGASQTLLYSSFFGGDSTDIATGVAVNDEGNLVYFTGYTFSSDFPTTGDGWQTTEQGYGDAFIVKLDLSKSGLDALVYGTCIGGTDLDMANGIALDPSGDVWITGYTLSVDFPVTANAAQPRIAGDVDGFVVRFTPSAGGNPLKYATYLGGSDTDVPNVIKMLPDGRVAVAGYTMSNDMPARGSSPAVRMADAFVTVIDPAKSGAAGLVSTTTFGGEYIEAITGLTTDASGNIYAAGSSYSFDLPTTDGSSKPDQGGIPSGFLLKLKP